MFLMRLAGKSPMGTRLIVSCLEKDSEWSRVASCLAIGHLLASIHENETDTVPQLNIDENDIPSERLHEVKSELVETIPFLVEFIATESNERVKLSAIYALGSIGAEIGCCSDKVVAALIEALQDNRLRGSAVEALGKLGEDAVAAVPALLESLRSSDESFQRAILFALSEGEFSRSVGPDLVPQLNERLHDSDPVIRSLAQEALEKISAALTGKNIEGTRTPISGHRRASWR